MGIVGVVIYFAGIMFLIMSFADTPSRNLKIIAGALLSFIGMIMMTPVQ